MIKYFLAVWSLLALVRVIGEYDSRLVGTWYAFDNGKLHSITFHQDKTFEFYTGGIDFSPKNIEAQGGQMTSSYSTTMGSVNNISMTINLVHTNKKALTLDLRGLYRFKNDTTLRLELRSSDEPDLQDFTSKSIVYRSRIQDLIPELPVKDENGYYIFTHEKEGQTVRDTITSKSPQYIGIDTVYQKIMNSVKKLD